MNNKDVQSFFDCVPATLSLVDKKRIFNRYKDFIGKGTIKEIASKQQITFGYTPMNVPPLINTYNFNEASDLITLENQLILEYYLYFFLLIVYLLF